jgi:PAS domain S-box-containing protein/diguanylate cyclase (GGDEF)-like protein
MQQVEELEILRSALEGLDIGVYATDNNHRVVYWNQAAEKISGYTRGEVIGRTRKENLLMYSEEDGGPREPAGYQGSNLAGQSEPTISSFYLSHRHGHRVHVHVKTIALPDRNGNLAGIIEYFWPSEGGETWQKHAIAESYLSREVLESRLRRMLAVAASGGASFGILRLEVDQAGSLRKTHGREAYLAMLDVAEETLHGGLYPSDICGRWTDTDFLVATHVRTMATLEHHAQTLRKLCGASDFRWWGDKIEVTLSIGGAMVIPGESMGEVLARVDSALEQSKEDGGNRVTMREAKEKTCSQSSAS